MKDWVVLALKAINGGLIVVLFALIGQAAKPKRFAGLFSAAPTVAIANLTVLAVASGADDIPAYGIGMLAGVAGFLAYTLLCPILLERFGSVRGSAVAMGSWFAVAGSIYWAVLR